VKKLNVVLLILSFILSGIGSIFLFDANSSTNDSIQTVIPPNFGEEEITEYTYKPFDDYFADLDFSNAKVKGIGTQADPYQINSLQNFLHIFVLKNDVPFVSKNNDIPDDYYELEYLESYGKEYIDTNIVANENMKFEIEMSTLYPGDNKTNLIGIGGGSAYSRVACGIAESGTLYIGIAGTNYYYDNYDEEKHKFTIDLKNKMYGIDDDLKQDSTTFSNPNEYNFYLFARNYLDKPSSYFKGKIYSTKIYENEELIHNFVPALRKSDYTYGLYDTFTKEFFVSNANNSFQRFSKNLYDKYLEINTNIVLNDESFDKDGIPYGGDGIVYNWNPVLDVNGMCLNGNGYSISGMYINDTTLSNAGLFGSSNAIVEMKNLTNKNLYVNGGECSFAFARTIKNMDNCSAYGFVNATKHASGIAHNVTNISSCNNYVDVNSDDDYASGLVFSVSKNGEMINCNNYGDISAQKTYAGGFISNYWSHYVYIKRCNNYGNVSADSQCGGFIAAMLQGNTTIEECNNYGNVYARSGAGGIIAYSYGTLLLNNVTNQGNINAQRNHSDYNRAGLIGTTRRYDPYDIGDITIINSTSIVDCSKSTAPAFMMRVETQDVKLRIENCKAIFKNVKNTTTYNLIDRISSGSKINLSNIDIQLISQENDLKFNVVGTLAGDEALTAKNILIKSQKTVEFKPFGFKGAAVYSYTLENVIYNCQNKAYIGSDFSGFYISWRTGNIGLVALDGRGQFQGVIDENWLKNKNYEKKEA